MEEPVTYTIFDGLVWSGAVLSIFGLVGLIWCIRKVWVARSAQLDDDALRVVLQGVVPINLAALCISVLGLILVILGIFLR